MLPNTRAWPGGQLRAELNDCQPTVPEMQSRQPAIWAEEREGKGRGGEGEDEDEGEGESVGGGNEYEEEL